MTKSFGLVALWTAWSLISGVPAALQASQSPAPPAAQPSAKPVDFDRDIRPILSDNCFSCHGPDEKQRQANLRLDIKDAAFASRAGYQIIVPGSAAKSRLYQRISASDKATRMPPPWSGKSFTDQQIELVRRWIDQGAPWLIHWAYVPPKHPELPKVENAKWPRN